MRNVFYKQVEIVLLLVITATALNLLMDLKIINPGKYQMFNQILILTIGYISICKLADIKQRWGIMLLISHFAFICQCAILYYAASIADYVAFAVSLYVTLTISNYARIKKDESEENKNEH